MHVDKERKTGKLLTVWQNDEKMGEFIFLFKCPLIAESKMNKRIPKFTW